ncbi:hypothetical protein [Metabacillus sediminilitoris]|uniref:Uncharacterized protein n=1 Tax=Metabacillus sediminilitoris TaxID=2567941 RepID=A0A4S4C3Q8_9BACI|nr:hypothetical protein [Metabacillus sediminilitoris]QGQ45331.1 hypothetical protein GMB29_08710 [Metabacillus sediminilitoris]THF82372.1 hypothetical protein E6W99_02770 [Metabacillus sediminilitoris]
MKKIVIILLTMVSILLNGCNIESKITEEQAKSIVKDYHNKLIGEVEIISVTTKFNKYIIEWENKENCEQGTDSVNSSGKIKNIESSIC